MGIHPNGMNERGMIGPIGLRMTTLPLASRNLFLSVPGSRPILTASSVIGISFIDVLLSCASLSFLSSVTLTIAHRPKGTSCRWGLNAKTSSFGVEGADALQTLLFRLQIVGVVIRIR